MLQVLNVNYNDVVGGQFNNFQCRDLFPKYNIETSFYVMDKLSDDNRVIPVWSRFRLLRRYVQGAIYKIEDYFSIQSILYPSPTKLFFSKYFRNADVVHYHIIHNGWFSLLAMPWLTRNKPSIWTIHDPWLLTGHCIYPVDCNRWQSGCGKCPYLALPIAMKHDRTAGMLRFKKNLIAKMPSVKFVVASNYMKNMLAHSAVTKNVQATVIPFGVDLEIFNLADGSAIREEYGIPKENIVLFFRSNRSPFKGVNHIRGALDSIIKNSVRPVTLLTVEGIDMFDEFIGKCQIIENRWEHNVEKMRDMYLACDIFLMPSIAEAFGVMAIEAMACGKPVVFFKGTSLDEVTFAPRAGVGANMGDAIDLARVTVDLINDESKRLQMGEAAREIAVEHYNVDLYLTRMSKLYKDTHYKMAAEATSR